MGATQSYEESLEQRRIERERRLGLFVGGQSPYSNAQGGGFNEPPRLPPYMLARRDNYQEPVSPSVRQATSRARTPPPAPKQKKATPQKKVAISPPLEKSPTSQLGWVGSVSSPASTYVPSDLLKHVRRSTAGSRSQDWEESSRGRTASRERSINRVKDLGTFSSAGRHEGIRPLLRQVLLRWELQETEERTALATEENRCFSEIVEEFQYYCYLETIRAAAFELFHFEKAARKALKQQEKRGRDIISYLCSEDHNDAFLSDRLKILESESRTARQTSPFLRSSSSRTRESVAGEHKRFIPPTQTKYTKRRSSSSPSPLPQAGEKDYIEFDHGMHYLENCVSEGNRYPAKEETRGKARESKTRQRDATHDIFPRKLFSSAPRDKLEIDVGSRRSYNCKYPTQFSVS